jgi:hypothetical protein
MSVCSLDLADGRAVSSLVPEDYAIQPRARCAVGSAGLRTLPFGVGQKHGTIYKLGYIHIGIIISNIF